MRAIYTLFLILIVFSCEPPVEKPPVNLVDKSTFKKIAIELHLLESYVEEEYKNTDTTKAVYNKLEKELFEKYKVSEDNYRNSYNYYMRNTTEMDMMYEEIVDSLGKMETQTRVKKKN